MSSYSRQQLESWLKTIEVKGGRVLDIGGSQKILNSKRLKVFEPDEYKILDLEVPHECEKKPDIVSDLNNQIFFMYKESMQYIGSEHMYKYDYAFAIEIMEYMWNPLNCLLNIYSFLKKGGILYISFQFIYPIHNPIDQDYLRYTPNGGRKLLKEAGFEILEETPRTFQVQQAYNDLIEVEKMKPVRNMTHNSQGLMIKAKKL